MCCAVVYLSPPVGSLFLDAQVVVSVIEVASGPLQSHESMLTGSALVYQGFALALRNSAKLLKG